MNKAQELLNLIGEKKKCKKNEADELTLADLGDLLQDLKKQGFDDKIKLQGMLDKAKEIAKQQGKEGDKEVIIGIFQGFFQAK